MIMEFKLLHILLAFMAVAVAASEAALSPEMYWESKLPNTPMPQAIRDILHPDLLEDKTASVDVGKGGVDARAGQWQPGGSTQVLAGVSTGRPGKRTNYIGIGKGGVTVAATGRKGEPMFVGMKPQPNFFTYNYETTETQVQDDLEMTKFFLEKDLVKGKTMPLDFTKSMELATNFLPWEVAGSIPFSSKNLLEVLNFFSVKPGSMEAELMKTTIKECEEPGIEGEEKYCATSLESMVDYARSKLGENLQAISTETEKETLVQQKYKIEEDVEKMMAEESKCVVCHKQKYPYAVFYCHKTQNAEISVVPLKGEDGSEVKAVAVCHSDTSKWNPKHLAFRVLGVEPGSVPICHFLPQDHIVWYGTESPIKRI